MTNALLHSQSASESCADEIKGLEEANAAAVRIFWAEDFDLDDEARETIEEVPTLLPL